MSLGERQGKVLALVGILLLALGMRTATGSFAPVFGFIDAELHVGTLVLGVVGALPLIGFATAGFVAPRVARAVGLERALLLAVGAAVLGQVGRALAGEAAGLIAGTLVTMLGVGFLNVLLPPTVKRYFPERIGLVSAVYLTLVGIGATTPGFVVVGLTEAYGWRVPLALWGFTVLLAAIPWLVLARAPRTATGPIDLIDPALAPVPVRVSREPIAWGLVLVMFGSAVAGYVSGAWMPTILRDVAGLDPAAAAALTSVVFAIGIPAALVVPALATRAIPSVALVVIAVAGGVTGWAGLAFLPAVAPVVWAVAIGAASVTFPLVLVQIASRSATPRIAARLSGFVQGVAYLTTAGVVFGIGVVHALTGGWTASLVLMAVLSVFPLPAIFLLRRTGRLGDRRRSSR